MLKIAVILTCHNRKDKTVACISKLLQVSQNSDLVSIEIFLTDDGCTDGTVEALMALNASVPLHILKGDGNLFWAKGMNLAWSCAIDFDFDGYLWLNDDTLLYDNIFYEIDYTHKYSLLKYGKSGIYVGSTCSSDTKSLTYGGHCYVNKFLNTLKDVLPCEDVQECEIANGNITYVSREVVQALGIFHKGYVHGADYDYTYLAHRRNYPILVMRGYLGECDNDHQHEGYVKFISLPLYERVKYLYSPKGLQFGGALLFQRRFFPWRYPFVFFFGWFKVCFPYLYCKLNKLRS